MEVQPAPAADAAVSTATPAPALSAPAAGGIAVSQPAAAVHSGIAPAIAKLFGEGGDPQPIPLNVSYRVEGKDIVTVFSDPKTGKEVAQFPPELLLGLAQFFDQQSGVTFDKNA